MDVLISSFGGSLVEWCFERAERLVASYGSRSRAHDEAARLAQSSDRRKDRECWETIANMLTDDRTWQNVQQSWAMMRAAR